MSLLISSALPCNRAARLRSLVSQSQFHWYLKSVWWVKAMYFLCARLLQWQCSCAKWIAGLDTSEIEQICWRTCLVQKLSIDRWTTLWQGGQSIPENRQSMAAYLVCLPALRLPRWPQSQTHQQPQQLASPLFHPTWPAGDKHVR